MSQPMGAWSALAIAICIAVTLGACSDQNGTSSDAPSASSLLATPPVAGTAATTIAPTPAGASVDASSAAHLGAGEPGRQYLYNLMHEPAYAAAFNQMDGAGQLPAWVRSGGVATPARSVQVDGQSLLVAQACKPHACPSQRIVLLYDATRRTLQGVFVDDPAPTPDAAPSTQAKLTWLGKPDAAVQAWLQHDLIAH